MAFERVDIDLANKPDWFLAVSPLGKTPVLQVGDHAIFESAVEARVAAAPWFDGENFSLVDAVFGPVFRYFDVLDRIGDFGILAGKPKLARWRKALAARPSVRNAVSPDYPAQLRDFIERRQSWLSGLQAKAAA